MWATAQIVTQSGPLLEIMRWFQIDSRRLRTPNVRVSTSGVEPASLAHCPVTSERASQSNAHSALSGVTTSDSSKASSARSDIAACEKPDAMVVSRIVEIDTTGVARINVGLWTAAGLNVSPWGDRLRLQ